MAPEWLKACTKGSRGNGNQNTTEWCGSRQGVVIGPHVEMIEKKLGKKKKKRVCATSFQLVMERPLVSASEAIWKLSVDG